MKSTVSFDDAILDLCSRFLLNCPDEDVQSIERVCFILEEAYWFYYDFYRANYPHLPQDLSFEQFALKALKTCPPPLCDYAPKVPQMMVHFRKYKSIVPVIGGILLNEDNTKILLIKGIGAKSWSFPRGKVFKGETDQACAIREVKEETGLDISNHLNAEHYIEKTSGGQRTRFYVIPNFPAAKHAHLKPLVRNEIEKVEWHDLGQVLSYNKAKGEMTKDHIYTQILSYKRLLLSWLQSHNIFVFTSPSRRSSNGSNNNKRPHSDPIVSKSQPVYVAKRLADNQISHQDSKSSSSCSSSSEGEETPLPRKIDFSPAEFMPTSQHLFVPGSPSSSMVSNSALSGGASVESRVGSPVSFASSGEQSPHTDMKDLPLLPPLVCGSTGFDNNLLLPPLVGDNTFLSSAAAPVYPSFLAPFPSMTPAMDPLSTKLLAPSDLLSFSAPGLSSAPSMPTEEEILSELGLTGSPDSVKSTTGSLIDDVCSTSSTNSSWSLSGHSAIPMAVPALSPSMVQGCGAAMPATRPSQGFVGMMAAHDVMKRKILSCFE